MKEIERYQKFVLFGGDDVSGKDGTGYYVKAVKEDNEGNIQEKFIEYTFISGTLSSTKLGERIGPNVSEKIKLITVSKAKARIILKLYENGVKYDQTISKEILEGKFKELPDFYIQKWILKGLHNLRRNNPLDYKKQQFEIDGFCSLFFIDKEKYFYCADLLKEKNFIRSIINGGIFHGIMYITANGLDYLHKIDKKTKISGNESVEIIDREEEYDFDVAISFAGEDREFARELAESLKARKLAVFFDEFEKEKLWGSNLYDHLSKVYTESAKFCIMIISENYEKKSWTNFERQNAQARAFRESREYILPVRLDNTKIPGLSETIGYISYPENTVEEIVDLVFSKLESLKNS